MKLDYRRILVLAALILATTATAAMASHFRYGNIRWRPTTQAQPNDVTFTIEQGWRWSAYGKPSLGQTVNVGRFTFGDGGFVNLQLTVTSIDSTADWFLGVATVRHAYPATTRSYTAEFSGCCRISSLQEGNRDRNYITRTVVTIDMDQPNASPSSGALPIFRLPHNAPAATFTLPASDPDGDGLTFGFASTSDSGLARAIPSGMSIDATTGVVTWDTRNRVLNGLYAVQFFVQDARGARIPVDLIVTPVTQSSQPPTMLIDGSAGSATFTAAPGTPVAFTATGQDPDGGNVTVSVGSLPPGATMTPSLPVTLLSPASSVFAWTPGPGDVGNYTITFAVTDATGLQDTNSVTIVVPQGNRLPTANAGANQLLYADATCTVSITIDGSGSTDPDGDSLTYAWTGDFGSLTGAVHTFTGVGPGAYLFSLTVSDGHGSSAPDDLTVSVIDNTKPTLTVFAPLTVEQTGPDGAFVTLPVVTGADNCPDVTIQGPTSGIFPAGTTDLTYTATDATGLVTTETTSVTVVDTIGPVVTGVDRVLEATGPSGAVATFTATAIDAVDGPVAAACEPASGSTFALGTSPVTCTATDAAGNVGTGTFTVTVQDTIAPALTLPTDFALHATGPAGAAVTFATLAVDIVSGTVPVACTPASGSTFPLGTTLVECSAVDGVGNRAAGSFTVDVTNQAPVCEATPSVASIWPPNGRLVPVGINGVSDPDGDAVSIVISGIAQDEPTNDTGDGNTAIDGFGVGTSLAQVRAERSGNGDGRFYHLSYTATDTIGASCEGGVTVVVPHDQGNRSTPIDGGPLFDSTVPTAFVPPAEPSGSASRGNGRR